MSDIRFLVRRLLAEGRVVLPVKPGEKATRFPKWQDPATVITESDFAETDNIAERLDAIVDIDCDCDETRLLAPKLLLATTRIHGRPSLGPSHYWYRTSGTLKAEQFKDTDGSVLVEIRTGHNQYTLIPPSEVYLKGPDGKPLTETEILGWDPDKEPANVDDVGLRRSVRSLATSALLARHWPSGSRHVAARDAAGFLAARDMDPREIEDIIRGAATAAKDDEVEDRARVARDTAKKFAAGEKTTGGPTLEASVGKDVVATLLKWYGGNTAVHDGIVDELNKTRFGVRVGKDYVYGLEETTHVVFQQARALFEEFSNQKVTIGEKTRGAAKGEKIIKTKFEIWREHPKKRTFRTVVFAPPPAPVDSRDYNLWTGFAVTPDPQPNPEGRCAHFLALIKDVICSGNQEYYDYLINLLAFTVQFPGVPGEVATVLKGEQGAGKGTFVRTFGSLFGRHYAHLDKTEQLAGKFNAALSGKVVVFADEAFFAGDKRDLGSLKRLITEPTLAIERKGIDVVEEPNFIHLFMATNEDWAHQAGLHERRFFTVHVSDEHRQDHEYFDAINAEIKSGGREALLATLLARTVDRRLVRSAPKTDELRVQQELSMTPEQKWWKEKISDGAVGQNGDWPEFLTSEEFHDDYIRWCDGLKIQRRVTKIDLMRRVLDPWLKGRVKVSNKHVRPLVSLTEARAIFDRLAGMTTPWDDDQDDKKEPGNVPF